MIADEVMALGPHGKWFSVDTGTSARHLVTAKAYSGLRAPRSATTHKIADYFEDHYFSHGHTYEAHPLTSAGAPPSKKCSASVAPRARRGARALRRQKLEALKANTPPSATCAASAFSLPLDCEESQDQAALQHHADKVEGKPSSSTKSPPR